MENAPANPTPSGSSKRVVITAVIATAAALLILAGIGVGVYFIWFNDSNGKATTEKKADSPAKVAEKYFAAIKTLDYGTAAGLASGELKEQIESTAREIAELKKSSADDQSAKEELQRRKTQAGSSVYTVKEAKIDGSIAEVSFTVKTGDEASNVETAYLKKVDGKWKMVSSRDYEQAKAEAERQKAEKQENSSASAGGDDSYGSQSGSSNSSNDSYGSRSGRSRRSGDSYGRRSGSSTRSGGSPSAVVRRFFGAYKNLDFDTAVKLSGGKEQADAKKGVKVKAAAADGDRDAQKQMEKLRKMFGSLSVDTRGQRVESDTAEVDIDLTLSGNTSPGTVVLNKVNGEWKVIKVKW